MNNLLEKEDAHKIIGEIYKITNLLTDKMYIGQTRSHYLNKGKYRPFGHIGRFNSHISESKSIDKQKACRYLNSAFNKYGVDNFKCDLLTNCPLDELDYYETKYISELDTKYPNGYNLTNGGQKCGFEKGKKVVLEEEVKPLLRVINGDNLKRTEKTKQLISKRLKDYKNNRDLIGRKNDMERVQKIHAINRFDKYKDVQIDNNIDKYIHIIKNNTLNYEYIRVTINKMRTTFVGQYETIEEIKQRARQFILEILEWQRIQTAGKSLEPSLPLTCGNTCEEHD